MDRDDRIRTCDLLFPKQERYQTALHPFLFLGNSLPRVYFCFSMQSFLNGDPSIRVSFFFLFCKSVFHQLATQLVFQTSSEKLSDDIERNKMGRGNEFSLHHRDGDEKE